MVKITAANSSPRPLKRNLAKPYPTDEQMNVYITAYIRQIKNVRKKDIQ